MQRQSFSSISLTATLTLATCLAAVGARAQSDPPLSEDATTSPSTDRESADSLLELIRGQQKLIEKQEKTIRALEQRLAKVETLALSSHNRLEEMDERPPDSEVSSAVEERLAELESSIQDLPETADLVAAGEFRARSGFRARTRL